MDQKYSVWIKVPHETVESIVRTLAGYGTVETDTHVFAPHVTVIGGLQHLSLDEILAIAENVAATNKPFTGRIGQVLTRDQFYQCVLAKADPESNLSQIHEAFRKLAYDDKGIIYNGPNGPNTYFPHLSLAYGRQLADRPIEEQKKIEKLLGCHFSGLETPVDSGITGITFPVASIAVMYTPMDDISAWKVTQEFQLKGTD